MITLDVTRLGLGGGAMIKGKPYEPPPAPYKPGDWVRFEGKRYRVTASSHTHTAVEGIRFAIWNFDLKKAKPPKSTTADRVPSHE